jgi:hypothetical protein
VFHLWLKNSLSGNFISPRQPKWSENAAAVLRALLQTRAAAGQAHAQKIHPLGHGQ